MDIALFGKTISEDTKPYIQQIVNKLEDINARIKVFAPYYSIIKSEIKFKSEVSVFNDNNDLKDKTDFLFSIGGDGTLLDTLTLVRDSGIPIMGINVGRLGFLSSISKDEICIAIDNIHNGEYIIDKRSLLKIKKPKNLFGELNYGLNELSISRKESTSLIVVHVYIDNIFVNSYWADGIIISTPTGSTAYSLSCGGPFITPGSKNFVITPIAPHNLTVRPIVISDNSKIRIKAEGRDKYFFVSLDSRFAKIDSSIEIEVEKSDFEVNLVQLENKDFYSAIREKLKWGLDIRN
ncbi:MAG: NAD kinase [Saprospiraceae bacterium]|nr:NAD kinase [Saprospiraceae bacterium]